MPEQYTYLAVDFFCIVFPFVFSFVPRFGFYKHLKFFLLPCLATGTFFVLWDILFTHIGVWSFNPLYVTGIHFFGLPVEEYLFFICIPYACTFTYYCVSLFFRFRFSKVVEIMVWLLIVSLAVTALFFLPRLYTSVTFFLLAACLAFLLVKKKDFLPAFFVSFVFILIPFFLSNGILTGSLLGRTVVMYNNNYNLGIRMYTIPLEDTFYGMLLLLMNVAGFEWMKQRTV